MELSLYTMETSKCRNNRRPHQRLPHLYLSACQESIELRVVPPATAIHLRLRHLLLGTHRPEDIS